MNIREADTLITIFAFFNLDFTEVSSLTELFLDNAEVAIGTLLMVGGDLVEGAVLLWEKGKEFFSGFGS